MRNNSSGITLVALVITIIILIILATISIQSLTNTGIFKRAQEAKNAMENAEAQQALMLNEYENELNSYYTPENKPQIKLSDAVKVGDYVKYIPDTVTNTDEKYTTLISNLGAYSGSNANTETTLTQEKDLKWRVLDIQDGQVRLISESPTTSRISFIGYNAYNNVVKLLDDACSTLYNNSKLVSKVQNLKIEDITTYMTTKPTEDTTTYQISNINYPNILLQEENQQVGNNNSTIKIKESEQLEFVTGKSISDTNSLKNTYWIQNTNNTDTFIDSKYYELFIGKNSEKYYETYLLSSRCILAGDQGAYFCVRFVGDGKVDGYGWCHSSQYENDNAFAFRPCILLNSNVQVISGDGSETMPFEIN